MKILAEDPHAVTSEQGKAWVFFLLFCDPVPSSHIGFAGSEELRGQDLRHVSPCVLCKDFLTKGQPQELTCEQMKGLLLCHTYVG